MRSISSKAVILISFLAVFSVYAEEIVPENPNSDIVITKTTRYDIERNKEGFININEFTEIERHYLSERTAKSQLAVLFEYPDMKIKGLSGKINGKKLHKNQIGDYYSNDPDIFNRKVRIHYILPEDDLNKGDIFQYSYTAELRKNMFFPLLKIGNDGYIGNQTYEFNHPDKISLAFDFFFPRDSITMLLIRDREKTVLEFWDIPRQPMLPFFAHNDLMAEILVTVKVDDDDITPTSPDAFACWYTQYAGLKRSLDYATEQEILERFGNAPSDTSRMREIHDYVRQNIRYVSEWNDTSGIIPHDPDSVYLKKYGDCKDRAFLVSCIADLFGEEVKMGLVNTDLVPTFGEKVHPSLYNHVVCVYPREDGTVYFDPTARYSWFGNPMNYLSGREILVLDTGSAHYERITPAREDPSLEIEVRGTIDTPDAVATYFRIRNELQYHMMAASGKTSSSEFNAYFEETIKDRLIKIGLRDIVRGEEFPDRNEFTAVGDFSAFMIASGNKIYFPMMPFVLGDKSIADRRNDSFPLYMGKSSALKLDMYIGAPGYEVIPDSATLKFSDDVYYTAKISSDSTGTIRLSYYYHRYPEVISGEVRESFIDFCLDLMQFRKKMFTILRRDREND